MRSRGIFPGKPMNPCWPGARWVAWAGVNLKFRPRALHRLAMASPLASNRPGRDAYAGHGYLPVYPAWYWRQFTIPASSKDRIVQIDFGGVYRDAIVLVNGQFLAQHPSGYTGFRIDITPAVKFGTTNEVAVFVDPRWFEGWWYEGAGIYRHVRLLTTDRLRIALGGKLCRCQRFRADRTRLAQGRSCRGAP